jgi:hypothetical protein
MLAFVPFKESQKLVGPQSVGLPAVAPQASSKASSASDSHHMSVLLQQQQQHQQQQQQVATEAVQHPQQPSTQDDGSLQVRC